MRFTVGETAWFTMQQRDALADRSMVQHIPN
jgi:hypothetical protein